MNLPKLISVMEDIITDTPGTLFMFLVDLEDGLPVVGNYGKYDSQKELISSGFSRVVQYILDRKDNARNPYLREILADFRELIFETDTTYLIITKLPDVPYGIAAAINKAKGKLGYLKSQIQNRTPDIIRTVKEEV